MKIGMYRKLSRSFVTGPNTTCYLKGVLIKNDQLRLRHVDDCVRRDGTRLTSPIVFLVSFELCV